MELEYDAKAWSHESVLRYYDENRSSTKDIYSSEWFFLKQKLQNGISVLDIGCAKGLMANVLSENLQDYSYVGIDISQQMIDGAKSRFPQLCFLKIEENDYSILGDEQFDLVLCLGVLPIHQAWRKTLDNAWQRTRKSLLIDLRESHLPSIEDKTKAYFKMDFDNPKNPSVNYTVPYNIINTSEALQTIMDVCVDHKKITQFGYLHPVSDLANCPIKQVMANVYCIERAV